MFFLPRTYLTPCTGTPESRLADDLVRCSAMMASMAEELVASNLREKAQMEDARLAEGQELRMQLKTTQELLSATQGQLTTSQLAHQHAQAELQAAYARFHSMGTMGAFHYSPAMLPAMHGTPTVLTMGHTMGHTMGAAMGHTMGPAMGPAVWHTMGQAMWPATEMAVWQPMGQPTELVTWQPMGPAPP